MCCCCALFSVIFFVFKTLGFPSSFYYYFWWGLASGRLKAHCSSTTPFHRHCCLRRAAVSGEAGLASILSKISCAVSSACSVGERGATSRLHTVVSVSSSDPVDFHGILVVWTRWISCSNAAVFSTAPRQVVGVRCVEVEILVTAPLVNTKEAGEPFPFFL